MADYTGNSIVDLLKSQGKPNDYASRAKLAQQYGIQNYAGTSDQNLKLVSLLKGNTGQTTPTPAMPTPQITPSVPAPKTQDSFQRDTKREMAALQSKGIATPKTPQETAQAATMTYTPAEIAKMSEATKQQLHLTPKPVSPAPSTFSPFSPEVFQGAGVDPKDFAQQKQNLDQSSKPTQTGLNTLQAALKMVNDPSKYTGTTPDLFGKLGFSVSEPELYINNLKQKAAEDKMRYGDYLRTVQTLGQAQIDGWTKAHDTYTENLNHLNDVAKELRGYQKTFDLEKMKADIDAKKQIALGELQAAKDAAAEKRQQAHDETLMKIASGRTSSAEKIAEMRVLGEVPSNIPSEPVQTAVIGTQSVTAQPTLLSALKQADAKMFAETGEHIKIQESYRTLAQQEEARKKNGYTSDTQESGADGLPPVAIPGQSFHEKGLAFDMADGDWQKAKPYLNAVGIDGGGVIPNDPGHFSMGEFGKLKVSGITGDPKIDIKKPGYYTDIIPRSGGLSQGQIDTYALEYISNKGKMPSLGITGTGPIAMAKKAIGARASEMLQGRNATVLGDQIQSYVPALKQQITYKTNTDRVLMTAEDSLKQITEAFAGNMNYYDMPFANFTTNFIKKTFGSQYQGAFEAAIQEVQTEYQQLNTRAGSRVSDQVRSKSEELIPKDASLNVLLAKNQELQALGKITVDDSQKEIDRITKDMNSVIDPIGVYTPSKTSDSTSDVPKNSSVDPATGFTIDHSWDPALDSLGQY